MKKRYEKLNESAELGKGGENGKGSGKEIFECCVNL